MDLRSRVHHAFSPFLSRHGFSLSAYDYSNKYFGNEILQYGSDLLDIRFVTDRGDFFVDIAPHGIDDWASLDSVLEVLGYPWGYLSGLSDGAIELLIEKEYERISELFRPEDFGQTKSALAELARRPRPAKN